MINQKFINTTRNQIVEVTKLINPVIGETDGIKVQYTVIEAQSQQVNIQRAFRQWLNTEFVAE